MKECTLFVLSEEQENNGSRPGRISEQAGTIEKAFRMSWQRRVEEVASDSAAPHSPTCDWLYFNMTMDGAGRIMPCCMAPIKHEKNLVFANFESQENRSALSIVNSPMAQLARKAFADRTSYEKEAPIQPGNLPFCASCEEKPTPPYDMHNVRWDIRILDPKRVVSDDLVNKLTTWRISGQR